MPQLDLVAIGASAGGLQALVNIVELLPTGLETSVLIVMHARRESYLPQILGRVSQLPVSFATDGEVTRRGRIYVAPPDAHLLVSDGTMRISRGPRENGFRPAIDPLFRSVARVFGPRAMGIVLSGALDDGTYGLHVMKLAGGICVVQDPDEATIPSMPLSAIRFVPIDHVLPAAAIAEIITRLAGRAVEGAEGMARKQRSRPAPEPEPQNPAVETEVQEMEHQFGPPSGLTCPDCGGALWEVHDGDLMRFRCHVGHQFTVEGLDAGQQDQVEAALWSAVRVLEEHADLRQRMAERTESSGMTAVSERFAESARGSRQQAHTIRELLFRRRQPPSAPQRAASRAEKRNAHSPGKRRARRP